MHEELMKKGFTLIELSLSIVFISILSLTIVLIVLNTISSYHRGLTLSTINTVGMDLVDEFRATLQNSPSTPVTDICEATFGKSDVDNSPYKNCMKDGGRKFVVGAKLGNVETGSKGTAEGVPLWGVFCTGAYSYIWNSGYFFNEDYKVKGDSLGRVSLAYRTNSELESSYATVSDFKLLKVQDETRDVCSAIATQQYNSEGSNSQDYKNNVIRLNRGLEIEPIEVLTGAEEGGKERNNLAIYDLSVAEPAASDGSKSLFYAMSMILGTVQGGVNIAAKGNYCATPEDYSENFDYCAINKFNFAVQATGG